MTEIEVGMKVRVLEDCGGTDRSYIGEVLEVVDITSNNLVELSNGWYYFPYRLEAVEEVKRCDSVKVGDVVRVTKLWAHNEYVKVGDIAKVAKLYDDGDILVTLDDEHYAVVSGYEKVKDFLLISQEIKPGDSVKLLRVARYEEGGFRGGHFPETDKKYIGKIGKVESEHGEYGYRVVFEDGVVALAPAFALEKVSPLKFAVGDAVRIVGPSRYGFDFTREITWPVKITKYDEPRKMYTINAALHNDIDHGDFPESSLESATIRKGDWVEIIGESLGGRTSDTGKITRIFRDDGDNDWIVDIGGIYNESALKLLTEVPIMIDGAKYVIPINKYQEVYNLITTGGQ